MFLYIDFFMPRETKKGIVLVAIGIYATSIFFIKILLASYHQLKWLFFERCCRRLRYDKGRVEKLKQFWSDNMKIYEKCKEEN